MFYKEALSKINKGGFWEMLVIDGVVGAGKTTLMKILKY